MNKEILRLAIPNILSNVSVPLLSMVDMMLMGHLNNEAFILAVSLGVMIFNFIYWGFGFLRMGTTGFTAQAYGQKNPQEQMYVLMRGLAVALFASGTVIALQWPILKASLWLVNADPQLDQLISAYYSVRIYAAPATISLYVFTGWFLGMQNARTPMFIVVIINLVNIALNLLFVRYYEMQIKGIALGTLISQYSGLLIAFFVYLKKYGYLNKYRDWQGISDLKAIKEYFGVNSDIIIRTVLLIFTFSFFKIQSGQLSDSLGAANLVLLEFLLFFAYGVDGFAFAAESIAGKYFGAKDSSKFRKAVIRSFQWGMGMAVIFSLIFAIFGVDILSLITNHQSVIEAAKPFLWWVVLAPLINTPAFIWDGVYIGTTSSKAMRNSMIIATAVFFVPVYYLLREVMGNHALWLAMTLFMFGRGLVLWVMAPGAIYNKL